VGELKNAFVILGEKHGGDNFRDLGQNRRIILKWTY
jgi:hypothetical protein